MPSPHRFFKNSSSVHFLWEGGRRSERRYCRGATVHKYSSFVHGGNHSQAGSKISTMSECISSLYRMPQSLLTGQLKEKPTYRVRCLYCIVHSSMGWQLVIGIKITVKPRKKRITKKFYKVEANIFQLMVPYLYTCSILRQWQFLLVGYLLEYNSDAINWNKQCVIHILMLYFTIKPQLEIRFLRHLSSRTLHCLWQSLCLRLHSCLKNSLVIVR